MSCNTCSKEFGLLTKEQGCPNCGFSYCGKCLKWSAHVPKLGKTKKVCTSCYDALNNLSKKPTTSQVEAPEALQKRMAALAAKGSVTNSNTSNTGSKNVQVEEIEKRLQRLRQDSKELIPAHADIEDRLAQLKGVDVSYYRKAPITVYKDKRSAAEKVSDLMRQAQSEAQIDARREESIKSSINEIEQRLNSLRGVQKSQDTKPGKERTGDFAKGLEAPQCEDSEDADVDMDDVAQLLRQEMKAAKQELEGLKKDKQLMAELDKISLKVKGKDKAVKERRDDEDCDEKEVSAVLQQVLDESRQEEEEMEEEIGTAKGEEKEELPWCTICNSDAALRCHDCVELYCRRCYREYHDDEGHRTSNYPR
ncbi:abscission/NoCut checkpoint regulator-like [Ornithodoros turicata]|uniref:abscission/NoCut checkpoint regulator-like n=1 Tax=Ornithodoros turicata TaxID=34597 RepID=UPI003138E892